MPAAINTDIGVRVENIFGDVWDSAEDPARVEISIEIDKDTIETSARVGISNLNDETKRLFSAGGLPDITLAFNRLGETSLVPCFRGQVVETHTEDDRPGETTSILCEGQTSYRRDKYVSLSYEGGTALETIIDALIEEIGLPTQSPPIPSRSILSAMALTGPAFLNLQTLLRTAGLFCYIVDGTLYISSVFEPPNDTIVEITQNILTSTVSPSTRRDVSRLWFTLQSNNATAAEQAKLYTVNKDVVKKATKQKRLDRNQQLIETDAVDAEITGVSFRMLGLPELQPDTVIRIEGDSLLYRVKSLTHTGDNVDGIETLVQADLFGGREA